MTPESKRDLSGKNLHNYLVRKLIGKGGMGEVYEAYEESLDRKIALKVLPSHLSEDESFTSRFLREARSAAKLEHPGICPVFAAGEVQGIYFIAMQFVDGESLGDILERFGNLPIEQALLVTRRVADALDFAHSRGFIHRDIKPDNIMIDREGRVKVMDFGLARTTALETRMTQTGMYVGTPEYSSPEQCETLDLDGRSDIYSLGVVFYEMLSGTVPHRAETPYALFTKICNESHAPIQELNPQVPSGVAAIVDRMLEKDRDKRYQSAAELITSIDTTLRTLNVDSTADTAAVPVPGLSSYTTEKIGERAEAVTVPLKYRKKKSYAPVLAVVIALAVIGLWLALALTGEKSPSDDIAGIPPTVEPQQVEPGEIDPEPVKQTVIDTPQPPKPMTGPEEGLPIAALLVCDFVNRNKNTEIDWMEIGVAEMFITDLAQCKFLRVVSREEFSRLLRRLGLKHDQALENLHRVTGELGAEMILKGNVVKIGTNIRIDIHLLDAGSGKILLTKTELDQEENFLNTIDLLSSALRTSIAEVVRKNHPNVPREVFAGVEDLSLQEQIFLADAGMAIKELSHADKLLKVGRNAAPERPGPDEKKYGKMSEELEKLADEKDDAPEKEAGLSRRVSKAAPKTEKLQEAVEKSKSARKKGEAAPAPPSAKPAAPSKKDSGWTAGKQQEGMTAPRAGGGRGGTDRKNARKKEKPGAPADGRKERAAFGGENGEGGVDGKDEPDPEKNERITQEVARPESADKSNDSKLAPARKDFLALRAYYKIVRKFESARKDPERIKKAASELEKLLEVNPGFKPALDMLKKMKELLREGK